MQRLEDFEIWIWKRMKKISWMDRMRNEEVSAQVNKMRTMLNTIRSRKHCWIGHVLRHDELLGNLMEGRMVGKPTRGRKRLRMLEENDSCEVLKMTAEDYKCTWRESTRNKVM